MGLVRRNGWVQRAASVVALGLALGASLTTADAAPRRGAAPVLRMPEHPPALTEDDRKLVVLRARLEISRVTQYTGEWAKTSGYPMGDIAPNKGACTDLVVRALRAAGIDLQRLVHEDILSAPDAYGIARPDPQIDHRRASVLYTYFKRHTTSLPLEISEPDNYQPGDVVFFGGHAVEHVGVVSDKVNLKRVPLLLENGGPVPDETEALTVRRVVGHFRLGKAAPLNAAFKVSMPDKADRSEKADRREDREPPRSKRTARERDAETRAPKKTPAKREAAERKSAPREGEEIVQSLLD